MKREWRYEAAVFHHSKGRDLVLARLTVNDDGSAEVLVEPGCARAFDSEDAARTWLTDEEYGYVEDLLEDGRLDAELLPPLEAPVPHLMHRLRIRIP